MKHFGNQIRRFNSGVNIMAAANNSLRNVPVASIRPNLAALRAVDKKTDQWKEFVDSIRSKGVLNPLVGRELKDKDTGQTYIGLVDGLHRFTGACEVGLETVPMHIITADDAEALEAQIVGNIQTIETRAAQYAAALKRLLVMNDTLTIMELAQKLGKSVTWLTERLKLTNLTEKIKELVDEGQITVTNAQALANLPTDEQTEYVDRAITMTPGQFVPLVNDRAKDIRDAQKQGKKAEKGEWKPTPYLQGAGVIRDELEKLEIGKSLLHEHGVKDPLEAWKLAVSWVLHLDEGSIKVERQKYLEGQKKKEEERMAKKAEKAKKAAEEAAKTAVAVEA
jgi:ParB/RepB/Spo0J family partition protein